MAGDDLANRLEVLEMAVDGLTGLPRQVQRLDGRIESLDRQFLHLREEMSGEFSAVRRDEAGDFAAVRREMATGFTGVRQEMRTEFAAVRQEMTTEFAAVRLEMTTEFAAVRQEMTTEFAAVRQEVSAEFAAVRRERKDDSNETRAQFSKLQDQMLRLHEEVMGQIAILQVDGRETRAQLLALYESLRTDIRSLREG